MKKQSVSDVGSLSFPKLSAEERLSHLGTCKGKRHTRGKTEVAVFRFVFRRRKNRWISGSMYQTMWALSLSKRQFVHSANKAEIKPQGVVRSMWDRGWGEKREGIRGEIQTEENVKLCWYAIGILISGWTQHHVFFFFFFLKKRVRTLKEREEPTWEVRPTWLQRSGRSKEEYAGKEGRREGSEEMI